jgi:hypothetical protein
MEEAVEIVILIARKQITVCHLNRKQCVRLGMKMGSIPILSPN